MEGKGGNKDGEREKGREDSEIWDRSEERRQEVGGGKKKRRIRRKMGKTVVRKGKQRLYGVRGSVVKRKRWEKKKNRLVSHFLYKYTL